MRAYAPAGVTAAASSSARVPHAPADYMGKAWLRARAPAAACEAGSGGDMVVAATAETGSSYIRQYSIVWASLPPQRPASAPFSEHQGAAVPSLSCRACHPLWLHTGCPKSSQGVAVCGIRPFRVGVAAYDSFAGVVGPMSSVFTCDGTRMVSSGSSPGSQWCRLRHYL